MTDAADPRLADYRDIQDRHLNEEGGKFVAESEMVVRKLLATDLRIHSVLLTAPRLAALESALCGDYPVFIVPQPIMDAVAGYNVHRGCLAVAQRPIHSEIPQTARTVLVLDDLVDVDNVGALARNGAALDADALLLSPGCADPYYRKAIRVSAGAVFQVPIVRAARWPDDLLRLREERGFSLVGAVLSDHAVPLDRYVRPERVAVILGPEGPGLSPATMSLCDALITIPMRRDRADSLNVAAAGAVILHHLSLPTS